MVLLVVAIRIAVPYRLACKPYGLSSFTGPPERSAAVSCGLRLRLDCFNALWFYHNDGAVIGCITIPVCASAHADAIAAANFIGVGYVHAGLGSRC